MRQQRPIDIEAQTRKREVDNRLSLKIYYRTAQNLLKQANIYRYEGNVVDLYIFLLRVTSLVSETIPQHRDYDTRCQEERKVYTSKLKPVLDELEALKDEVYRQVAKINSQLEFLDELEARKDEVNPQVAKLNSQLRAPSRAEVTFLWYLLLACYICSRGRA